MILAKNRTFPNGYDNYVIDIRLSEIYRQKTTHRNKNNWHDNCC